MPDVQLARKKAGRGMSATVRPRITAFLACQESFVHVGGIARGAQVSAPSVRMVLRELESAGLEIRPAENMPGPAGPGYRLRLDDPARGSKGANQRVPPAGKIRVEFWVPVRCVTELDPAEVEAAMRSGYDLDGLPPEAHPAADAADIARRLRLGEPVTGPWRMKGAVFPEPVFDDGSDYGRLAAAIEANPELLDLPVPFLPDDAGNNRVDADEVRDVRVFPAAGCGT